MNFQSASSLNVEVNGTPISSTNPINFESSAGVVVSNPSAGNILITNSAPGAAFGSGVGAFFVGPGIVDAALIYGSAQWNAVAANIANGSLTANQVVVYLFELFASFTISKATVTATNSAAGTASFGIYTAAGAKVLDAGSFVELTGSGIQTNSVNSGTPVTLPPGVYWHAQAGTTSGTMTFVPGVLISAAATNSLLSMLRANAIRTAIAANAMVGGVLPATLGTLTPFSPSNSNGDGVVCPLYE